ncbi:uncharacterized protein BX664DRAFT_331250, partial [Halteromyces radiatus]|uniref:uncharacterized protein n=1 Tax=Halteromyces radiatus TaxID=101107 RepID=UPI00221F6444
MKKTSTVMMVRYQYTKPIIRISPAALHTSSIQQKGILEKAKDLRENVKKAGHEVNMKVGKGLAHGIEEVEAVAHKVPHPKDITEAVKHATHEANLKAGKGLAHGIDSAKATTDKVQQSAQSLKGKDKMSKVKEQVKEKYDETKESASKGVEKVEDALGETSEKIGSEERNFKQAEHRLEDEVEDAVERLQHKRD